jgi:hypothetical protein
VPQIDKGFNNIPHHLPSGIFILDPPSLRFREKPCRLSPPTPLIYSSHRSKRLLGLGIRVGGFIIARAGASSIAAPAAVVVVVVVPHHVKQVA